VDVRNGLGQSIASPLVICNGRALALPDLPAGASSVAALRVNDRDDFTGTSMLASEQSKRRGLVVRGSLLPPAEPVEGTSRGEMPPMLVGWLMDSSQPAALIAPADTELASEKAMVLVRTPLRIEPPAAGTKLSLPAALATVDTGHLPYDIQKGESVPTQEQGTWLVGFSVPPQLGQVRPTRVTLEAQLTFPTHALVIRRGQCAKGSPKMDPNGAVLAEWGHEVASKRVSMDCSSGDFDRAGRVWLLLDIHPVGASGGTDAGTDAAAGSWQIKDLTMAINAEAIAPPKPIAQDVETHPAETESR